MVSQIEIEDALVLAEQIVNAIVKVAPAITAGAASAAPYISAIGGMISGGNATQDDVDALLAIANADSEDFQKPLPPDDGTTTT